MSIDIFIGEIIMSSVHLGRSNSPINQDVNITKKSQTRKAGRKARRALKSALNARKIQRAGRRSNTTQKHNLKLDQAAVKIQRFFRVKTQSKNHPDVFKGPSRKPSSIENEIYTRKLSNDLIEFLEFLLTMTGVGITTSAYDGFLKSLEEVSISQNRAVSSSTATDRSTTRTSHQKENLIEDGLTGSGFEHNILDHLDGDG